MSEQSDSVINSMEKLARDVLLLSRNTLLVHLRFLDAALNQFVYVCGGTDTLCTDGKRLFYSPVWLLGQYKQEQTATNRCYLHMVLHCVFRHMYGVPYGHKEYWNLACDMAVEAAMSDLNLKALNIRREEQQKKALEELKPKVGILSAEKIYRYLLDAHDGKKIEALQQLFRADDHCIWYCRENEEKQGTRAVIAEGGTRAGTAEEGASGSAGKQGTRAGTAEEGASGSAGKQGTRAGTAEEGTSGGAEENPPASARSRSEQEKVWKEIASRMQVDLETFGKQRGDGGGSLAQNLSAVNREKHDYASFLKKFAVLGETMKINDDEFDYIFYTYGLQLYRKMPLIEPLEYKEVKRIKEFVVAIDTSGSVSGQLVQTFVQKTYNILKSEESFFTKINLHIIQCDAEIQEHVKITSQQEFDQYLETMTIKGLGGTDFRPVFQEVNRLIREREFSNLKGLIYLTDGYGTFPQTKPDYTTAFVFVEDGYKEPAVPPWAIRLVLQPEEV